MPGNNALELAQGHNTYHFNANCPELFMRQRADEEKKWQKWLMFSHQQQTPLCKIIFVLNSS